MTDEIEALLKGSERAQLASARIVELGETSEGVANLLTEGRNLRAALRALLVHFRIDSPMRVAEASVIAALKGQE